ncbi:Diheme class I cytochrome c [Oceaniovalibus guishaninsula JLT2003]|uniref:Diheme class I cytochrome c n=1 Tax=Oceaniovalibus guishaninsula JLT2003 TaxID=1231392 RepID=K2GLJ3_9RHOB|nr:cytochrome c [Oceaniovalibus guishaninsula]EKE43591.1 Diheme class I cytochrome c [Oceaniovalibus guishaninsula JLT2003]
MRRGLIAAAVGLVAVGAAAGWAITAPRPLPADVTAGLAGDPVAGEYAFLAAGCASCHVAPDDRSEGPPVLSGGQRFVTQFGTFIAPNISPSPQGTGGWTEAQMVNAMARGVSPGGRHYYPAFPYTSYAKADPADLADIAAYIRTLPPSDVASLPHEVGFPFNIRRVLGGWKLLNLDADFVTDTDSTPQLQRGRYLVEAMAHCGECHTPRGPLGGLDTSRWLSGAPNPSGKGTIPAIDPGHLDWSEGDIAMYLTTGLTPDYDSAGGHMVAVIDKLSQLPREDVDAITAYLKAIPPVEGPAAE